VQGLNNPGQKGNMGKIYSICVFYFPIRGKLGHCAGMIRKACRPHVPLYRAVKESGNFFRIFTKY
jgi:hypothetical protein